MLRNLLIACVILAVAVVTASVVMACRAVEPAPVIPSSEVREEMPQTAVLEIQYIANEGVLISSRDKRVLIDGLHRKYEDSYAYLPDVEREKIEAAKPPFDRIDLILVSHRHGDHFHPDSVGSYLRSSKTTLFASSQQVVDETAAYFAGFAEIKERVTAIPYELRSRKPMRLADIDVEFLGVGHGSGRHAAIQNLGHVITIGGKRVVHIGDADFTPEIFDAFDLETRGIDIAVLPFWFLTAEGGRKIVEQHIKPKHIIATHIGPAEAKQTAIDVKKHFPNADVFTTLLEKRSF
jgi:L-ascorbate metabolism protein UlaG (beta-lactamase superfamily)